MERDAKKAIVLGATGLVGRLLTLGLLDDKRYSGVRIFARNPFGLTHTKLTETRADLLALQEYKAAFKADVVFCCVGTTKAKTPDEEDYRAIDYGIPAEASRLCRENGIPTLIVVSALGANPESRIFYNRIKGEMEAEVLRSGVPHIQLLQPSLIGGNRQEVRKGEQIAQKFMRFLKPLLTGPLKKYRMVDPSDIADAMIFLVDHPQKGPRIPSDEIIQLAQAMRSEQGNNAQRK
jgi:uncharacterized protein YbjT (DUF2867 family)